MTYKTHYERICAEPEDIVASVYPEIGDGDAYETFIKIFEYRTDQEMLKKIVTQIAARLEAEAARQAQDQVEWDIEQRDEMLMGIVNDYEAQ